ncbi:MAG: hypothetical protein QOJ25_2787, partial [Solirubrobacteraceae bacterium]|nr:hypothetical protein [Solirubrobacteraceae bacterium]
MRTAPSGEEPEAVAGGRHSDDVNGVATALAGQGYLAGREVATVLYLATALEQPLLLEGEAGVGKTELARAWASA